MTAEWFSAGQTSSYGPDRERLVRVWEPGDGIRCSAAGYNGRFPCGEPVAVVKDVMGRTPGKSEAGTINRVFCLRHVAKSFCAEVGTGAEAATERAALEELAQRYWDQYQEIHTRISNELLEARFSALPTDLRIKVIDIVRAEASA